MLIGALRVELFLPESGSLKEKRFVLQSLKNKLRNAFNVSVAEVDFQDKWQRSCVAVTCVSTDRKYIDSVFSKVLNTISNESRVEIIDQVVDFF